MNKFMLKIAGFMIFVLVVIIVANVFWPAGSAPTVQSPDLEQIQQENTSTLEAPQLQAKQVVEPATPKRARAVKQKEVSLRAENLYKMALRQKEKAINSPNTNYEMMMSCCQQILKRHPNSSQAEKAKELLQEIPEKYRKQYSARSKVKKLRRRRHRPAYITVEEPGL